MDPADTHLTLWEQRAQHVISALSLAAWRETNAHRGVKRKQSKPYVIPALASDLVQALGIHDPTQREICIKTLLGRYDYLTHVGGNID